MYPVCTDDPVRVLRAPRARTRRGEIQEHEAEQDRRLAHIRDRPRALGEMMHPVSDGHFAGRDERGDPREQPERDEHARQALDHPGGDEQRRQRMNREWYRKAEKFRQPVLEEKKPEAVSKRSET